MKRLTKRSLALLLAVLLLSAAVPAHLSLAADTLPPGLPPTADSHDAGEFSPGEVLAPAGSWEEASQIAAAYGLQLNSYACGIAVLAAPEPEREIGRSQRIYGTFANGKRLPRLSLNRRYTTYDTYEPYAMPDSGIQWHHGELDTDQAWAYAGTKGAGVVVAVIDTGINIDHIEFSGRILPNSYNSHTNQVGTAYVRDDQGHGTHVAGIVAASAELGTDVCGVAPEAGLLVIKANESDKGSFWTDALLRGINYAADNGAAVINMSLGRDYGDGVEDDLERSVIAAAVAKGVTVVCAAGNERAGHAGYPAAYPESIAVSALKQGYAFDHGYSNYGPEIDVAAPGSNICATSYDGGYESKTGTSMASPNAAGVAALIKARNPGFTARQVRDALCGTARDAGALGRDEYYGHGVVNARAAMLGAGALCDVTFDYNDGVRAPVTVKAAPGSPLLTPDVPRRDGCAFTGWYGDASGGQPFDFSAPVGGSVTLYAQWVPAVSGMYVAEFPDPAFRREVLELLNGDGNTRTESDVVSQDDKDSLAQYGELSVAERGIRDLSGIGYFTGLTELMCYGNQLTSLDISANTALMSLSCGDNQLASLDLGVNTALEYLYCYDNQLTSLDVANSAALEYLSCHNNQLASLNVANNTALTSLLCSDNQLMSLDITNNVALTELWCDHNRLTALDVAHNTALFQLLCDNNQLTALDVANNTALTGLWCYNNQLTSLDVTYNTALIQLLCHDNQLTALNVANNTALTDLWCNNNQLTVLDVTANTELTQLYCQDNQLTALDVGNNTALIWFWCDHNFFISEDAVTGLDKTAVDKTAIGPEGEPYYKFHPQNAQLVVFRDHDGTELAAVTALNGVAPVAPPPPSRPGYTFTGWALGEPGPQGHFEATAVYTDHPDYTVPGAVMLPVPPSWRNAAQQQGWATSGAAHSRLAIDTGLTLAQVKAARYLVLELNAPSFNDDIKLGVVTDRVGWADWDATGYMSADKMTIVADLAHDADWREHVVNTDIEWLTFEIQAWNDHWLDLRRAYLIGDLTLAPAAVTVTAPKTGVTPVTAPPTAGPGYTCGAVTWTPTVPAAGKFLGGTPYTAAVTLTADSGYTFPATFTATINGQPAAVANNTGNTVTITYTFPSTAPTGSGVEVTVGVKILPEIQVTITIYLNATPIYEGTFPKT